MRFYEPGIGRFIARDMLRLAGRNGYGYAGNRPTVSLDPLGLVCEEELYELNAARRAYQNRKATSDPAYASAQALARSAFELERHVREMERRAATPGLSSLERGVEQLGVASGRAALEATIQEYESAYETARKLLEATIRAQTLLGQAQVTFDKCIQRYTTLEITYTICVDWDCLKKKLGVGVLGTAGTQAGKQVLKGVLKEVVTKTAARHAARRLIVEHALGKLIPVYGQLTTAWDVGTYGKAIIECVQFEYTPKELPPKVGPPKRPTPKLDPMEKGLEQMRSRMWE